jgi:hypothetical protein
MSERRGSSPLSAALNRPIPQPYLDHPKVRPAQQEFEKRARGWRKASAEVPDQRQGRREAADADKAATVEWVRKGRRGRPPGPEHQDAFERELEQRTRERAAAEVIATEALAKRDALIEEVDEEVRETERKRLPERRARALEAITEAGEAVGDLLAAQAAIEWRPGAAYKPTVSPPIKTLPKPGSTPPDSYRVAELFAGLQEAIESAEAKSADGRPVLRAATA